MVRDNFLQRKKDVLKKSDKSSIGGWDEKIKSLCDKINKTENFYTTSSCSGRIVLMIEQEKKSPDLFLKVWHDKIKFEELKEVLESLTSFPSTAPTTTPNFRSLRVANIRKNKNFKIKKFENNSDIKNKLIKFKLEQPIVHVVCKDLESASELLEKAKSLGFKHSGILTAGRNIVIELGSTEKLEFPIIKDGKILVDDNFLKLIVKISNEKLERGWIKIKNLEKLVK